VELLKIWCRGFLRKQSVPMTLLREVRMFQLRVSERRHACNKEESGVAECDGTCRHAEAAFAAWERSAAPRADHAKAARHPVEPAVTEGRGAACRKRVPRGFTPRVVPSQGGAGSWLRQALSPSRSPIAGVESRVTTG